jgi:predicted metal-dependent HD superfamily phosphohydrolase
MNVAQRWQETWNRLRLTAPPGLLAELTARYAEPHRAYHTRQHLEECFAALEPAASLARRLGEVEVALWFHDAVYDTRAHDNEALSADWARTSLLSAGANRETADRVHALVLATAHRAAPADPDAQLLVDVDLGILGAPEERFVEYERQIREEYAWVPGAVFRERRARVLASFLERPAIYSSAYFASRLEAPARANLRRSLTQLGALPAPP